MPRVHYALLSGFVGEIFYLKREGNKGGRERRCERQKKWEREGGRKGRQASWLATVKKTKNGNKYRKEKNEATTGILWNGTLPPKVAPFSSNHFRVASLNLVLPLGARENKLPSCIQPVSSQFQEKHSLLFLFLVCSQIIHYPLFPHVNFYSNIKFLAKICKIMSLLVHTNSFLYSRIGPCTCSYVFICIW